MLGLLSALLLAAAPTSVFAQQQPNTDVTVELSANDGQTRFLAGSPVGWKAVAVNHGPSPAQKVVMTFDLPGEIVGVTGVGAVCSGQHPIRCTMQQLPVNEPSNIIYIGTKAPTAEGDYTATAAIRSANAADVAKPVRMNVAPAADLSVAFLARQPDWMSPGEVRDLALSVANGGSLPARDVRLVVRGAGIREVTPAAGAPLACTAATDGSVCTGTLEAHSSARVNVRIEAPQAIHQPFSVTAQITSAAEDADTSNNLSGAFYRLARELAVTTTADRGPGSLRQAILDSGSECAATQCRIVFRIPLPVPESGAFTIHPESPLPVVSGMVIIDGGTQSVSDAPVIRISGDLQPNGDGITIDAACQVQIRGLAIDGFGGGNGISVGRTTDCRNAEATDFPVAIRGNVITGNLRGIGGAFADSLSIDDNVIGDNRRSAIFLSGVRVASIFYNFLGLTRDGVSLPNGASGIYVDTFSANITANTIANNPDFGIAISAFSPAIGMHRNRVFDSGHTAIDVGLDLESPNGDDVHRTMLNHPVLLSAQYDPVTDRTVVRGRSATGRNNGPVVLEFYAGVLNGGGHAQMESFLGDLKLADGHGEFEFVAVGDLTGQWISATATVEDTLTAVRDVTSELSDPIRVSP